MVIVFDTETTGLPNDKHAAPISLGAVALDASGAEVSTFYALLIPRLIDTVAYGQAERIHGISLRQLVADGLPSAQVMDDFRTWWTGLGKPMMYAFNISFDSEMMARAGWEPKGYWGPCLMRGAAQAMGRSTVSLNAAAKHFSGQKRGTSEHNALEDARLAAAVGRAAGVLR